MKTRNMLVFLGLLLLGDPVLAQGNGEEAHPACHLLLTEQECADHQATLNRLPAGAARQSYLNAHRQLLREREQSCACFRDASGVIRASRARPLSGNPPTQWF